MLEAVVIGRRGERRRRGPSLGPPRPDLVEQGWRGVPPLVVPLSAVLIQMKGGEGGGERKGHGRMGRDGH